MVNGADLEQRVDLVLAALLGEGHGTRYAGRNVGEGRYEAGSLGAVSAAIPPHDCLLLVLRKSGDGP